MFGLTIWKVVMIESQFSKWMRLRGHHRSLNVQLPQESFPHTRSQRAVNFFMKGQNVSHYQSNQRTNLKRTWKGSQCLFTYIYVFQSWCYRYTIDSDVRWTNPSAVLLLWRRGQLVVGPVIKTKHSSENIGEIFLGFKSVWGQNEGWRINPSARKKLCSKNEFKRINFFYIMKHVTRGGLDWKATQVQPAGFSTFLWFSLIIFFHLRIATSIASDSPTTKSGRIGRRQVCTGQGNQTCRICNTYLCPERW